MALPRAIEARDYYRCAFQRYEEARFLLRADYSNASVYLAGYAVECMLKALILDSVPQSRVDSTRRAFIGREGHDFGQLRARYHAVGGPRLPASIVRQFTLVSAWSTDLRYVPRKIRTTEAAAFLTATSEILRWSDERTGR